MAGYHVWRRMDRQVRRGAKAIAIWCPIIRQIENEETGLPVELRVGFTPCSAFADCDLADIDTNPLPTLWRRLPDDVEEFYQCLRAQIEARGFSVEEKPLPFGRRGASSPDGRILIAPGLDSRNRVMLLHELAHQLEHFRPERAETTREWEELEAESVAAAANRATSAS